MNSNLPTVQQEELFDASELPLGLELLHIDDNERRGVFTGERIARDKARYQAIVQALAEGLGIRQIARAFKVSPHTISAIREREVELIATEKQGLIRLAGRACRLSLERYVEALEKNEISPGQIPVGFGIIMDKKLLLEGEATSRIETTRREFDRDAVTRYIEGLPSANPAVAQLPDSGSGVNDENAP